MAQDLNSVDSERRLCSGCLSLSGALPCPLRPAAVLFDVLRFALLFLAMASAARGSRGSSAVRGGVSGLGGLHLRLSSRHPCLCCWHAWAPAAGALGWPCPQVHVAGGWNAPAISGSEVLGALLKEACSEAPMEGWDVGISKRKNVSTSWAIRKMQYKTTTRYHCAPFRWLK